MKRIIAKMHTLKLAYISLIDLREAQYRGSSDLWRESDEGLDFFGLTERLREMLTDLKGWIAELKAES